MIGHNTSSVVKSFMVNVLNYDLYLIIKANEEVAPAGILFEYGALSVTCGLGSNI